MLGRLSEGSCACFDCDFFSDLDDLLVFLSVSVCFDDPVSSSPSRMEFPSLCYSICYREFVSWN